MSRTINLETTIDASAISWESIDTPVRVERDSIAEAGNYLIKAYASVRFVPAGSTIFSPRYEMRIEKDGVVLASREYSISKDSSDRDNTLYDCAMLTFKTSSPLTRSDDIEIYLEGITAGIEGAFNMAYFDLRKVQ